MSVAGDRGELLSGDEWAELAAGLEPMQIVDACRGFVTEGRLYGREVAVDRLKQRLRAAKRGAT